MSALVEIVTGDDISIIHPLASDHKKLNVPTSSIVICRLVSADKSIVYSAEVSQVSSQDGADWANGLINIQMSSAITAAITTLITDWGRGAVLAYMETQINNSGKDTFFSKLVIVRGNVA